MAQDAGKLRAGVCHWRVYTIGQQLRRGDFRVLRRRESPLCGQDAKWLHTLQLTRAFQAAEASGNPGMPVCKSARAQIRPLGSGVNRGEDEDVSVA